MSLAPFCALAICLVALKNGEAGSFKGKGKREEEEEQFVKIVASINQVLSSTWCLASTSLAEGAPSIAPFNSQMTLDIIIEKKRCARTEEEEEEEFCANI